MERKTVVVMLMVMLVLMFPGRATAGFDQCYAHCYAECVIDMRRRIPYVPGKLLPCAWMCLKHCMFHPASIDLFYCQIGCAIDSCFDNIDDATKMAGCVENCGNNFCKN
ncbi:hypothetical protein Patl1_34100 [Pistacia atlantica]|uniref:Uncharacterized protein n=1 Tax=Pistacia atlantica TaxID=434234 RepID=A0ACC0ZQ19_9ROSI|nr:hypothetical protein Patl1_34100 [Pistacia atlantica]